MPSKSNKITKRKQCSIINTSENSQTPREEETPNKKMRTLDSGNKTSQEGALISIVVEVENLNKTSWV
jgi:hypothetical protein